MKSILNVNSSPHLKHPDTTTSIMLDVIIALSPACVFGCILFGWRAAVLIFTCIATALLSEFLWNKIHFQDVQERNWKILILITPPPNKDAFVCTYVSQEQNPPAEKGHGRLWDGPVPLVRQISKLRQISKQNL